MGFYAVRSAKNATYLEKLKVNFINLRIELLKLKIIPKDPKLLEVKKFRLIRFVF